MNPKELIARYSYPVSQPEFLDGLDDFDWTLVTHAHGRATDIPALLHAAHSDNGFDRKFAFALLHETVWHQGTVYEASPHVVPFLISMLEAPLVQDKESIVLLLSSLATGYSSSESVDYAQLTKEAVGERISLLLPYLESEAGWSIAEALALYPEHAPETVPALHKALESAQDVHCRELIKEVIAKLVQTEAYDR